MELIIIIIWLTYLNHRNYFIRHTKKSEQIINTMDIVKSTCLKNVNPTTSVETSFRFLPSFQLYTRSLTIGIRRIVYFIF